MAGKHENMGVIKQGAGAPAWAEGIGKLPPGLPGLRTDRAFCEGRASRAAGGTIQDNPFGIYPGTESPEYIAWRVGLSSLASDTYDPYNPQRFSSTVQVVTP
jgi:hypothetical protein